MLVVLHAILVVLQCINTVQYWWYCIATPHCNLGGIAAQVVAGAALNTRPGSPSRLIVLAARVIILIIIVKISTVGDEIKTQGQFCQDNSHAKVEV